MRRALVAAIGLAVTWPHVGHAKGKDKKDEAADSDDDDDDDKSDDAPKTKGKDTKAKDKDKDAAKDKAKGKDAPKDKAKRAPKDKDADTDDDQKAATKAKAKASDKDKDAATTDDDSDDDKSKFGGKKETGADAIPDDDSSGSDSGSAGSDKEQPLQKQDLNGHDLGPTKKSNAFEQDRFWVDKKDDKKTEQGTLIQGSLTETSLLYTESGSNYPVGMGATPYGSDAAAFTEAWTDLRLQTDFRHIAASRWDARVDARIRLVYEPPATLYDDTPTPSLTQRNFTQSGFNGQNEYDLRELWIARNGESTDVFFGRQYIADLAAVKIDGIRIDYASSQRFTLLGFAGLFPVRGSRSLTTDYVDLKSYNGTTNTLDPEGKLVGAGGFGAAYRTESAYGSFGGVAELPFEGEGARIFATGQGYWRYGSTLDFYHFALIDLFDNQGITNLSAGLNYKPNPRLRITANFNRVDTDTLNVQAYAFFNNPSTAASTLVQNQLYIARIATNAGRVGVSAGLGDLERFELTVAGTVRERPGFDLHDPTGNDLPGDHLAAAESAELYASITDRRSIAGLRLGADVMDSFAIGSESFQRADVLAVRVSAQRDLASGKGQWEAEAAYTKSTDQNAGGVDGMPTNTTAVCTTDIDCFGISTATVLSIGGTLYYRINRDWLMVASAFLTDTGITSVHATNAATMGSQSDPGILGLTGFYRIAYRF